MDTFKECFEIVSSILDSKNIQLSLIEGDETIRKAYVEIDRKTVHFPLYQEPLLIIFTIGSIDQFLSFYLSLMMLQNDEYELCEELLNKLENCPFPKNTDPESLYRNTLIKQLFIILHECGHYYNSINDEINKIVYKSLFREMNSGIDASLIDSEMSVIIDAVEEYAPGSANDVKKVLLGTDARTKRSSMGYSDSAYKIDETAADFFAIIILDEYLRTRADLVKDNVNKIVIKALSFVYNLFSLELLIEKGDDFDKQKLEVELVRFGFVIGELTCCFDDDENNRIINEFIRYNLALLNNASRYQKYIDSWREGNCNIRDEAKYDDMKARINVYTQSLKQLYQFK